MHRADALDDQRGLMQTGELDLREPSGQHVELHCESDSTLNSNAAWRILT
jgi:hypothetical protein